MSLTQKSTLEAMMQKWEYLRLTRRWEVSWGDKFSWDDGFDGKVKVQERLNLLGEEGWELVSESVESGETHARWYFTLKRPKS